jgi:acetyl esterase/lipase
MYLITCLVLLVLAVWAFEYFYLRGGSPENFPPPANPDAQTVFSRPEGPGAEHQQVVQAVRELILRVSTSLQRKNLRKARAIFDSISDGRRFDGDIIPANAGGVTAEWIIAPGADKTRCVLYIHGGGFVMGSPKSHRAMTCKFAEVAGCAVLAIDYRLMPENKLVDCIEDCRKAYRWILENGPDGPAEPRQLFVSGDSAGGHLSLSLAAWARDNGLRAADAVVAFSPLTDTTFSGASIRDNVATDDMLKRFMQVLNRLPQFIKSWWALWTYKLRPADPLASPLRGDLSNLPPTLVQVSAAEMLFDDARRYVYKACASGSAAKLQSWTDMVHIWQIFNPLLPQAEEAWVEVGKFLENR